MISRAEFEALLQTETKARDFYNDILERIDEGKIYDKIASIRDDEEKHMKIAQRLVDLVNK